MQYLHATLPNWAALAEYVEAPAASIANVPWLPTVPACATNVAGLSTSLIVSAPDRQSVVEVQALVRLRVSDDRTAPSSVPRMLMVTEVSVPSALATEKMSV